MHVSYREPKDLAVYLAYTAKKMRKTRNMREDDITVIVVDVNPNRAIFGGKKYIQSHSLSFVPSKAVRSVSSDASLKEVLHLRSKLTKSYTAVAEGPWPSPDRQSDHNSSHLSKVQPSEVGEGGIWMHQMSYSIKEESKCVIQ